MSQKVWEEHRRTGRISRLIDAYELALGRVLTVDEMDDAESASQDQILFRGFLRRIDAAEEESNLTTTPAEREANLNEERRRLLREIIEDLAQDDDNSGSKATPCHVDMGGTKQPGCTNIVPDYHCTLVGDGTTYPFLNRDCSPSEHAKTAPNPNEILNTAIPVQKINNDAIIMNVKEMKDGGYITTEPRRGGRRKSHRKSHKKPKSRKHKKKHYHKTTRKKSRKIRRKKITRRRKYQKGGVRKCISGGPQSITILTKDDRKIILIGEHHLSKPNTEEGKQKMRRLIQKSIDKDCIHFSGLIERLIKINDDRTFDLFLEISPQQYKGDFESLGSGGLKIMTKLKKKHFPNLRIHWTDLRSIVKENESTSYSLSKEDLQKLYGISENNLYWKIIIMLKTGGFGFQRMELLNTMYPPGHAKHNKTLETFQRLKDKDYLNLDTLKIFTTKIMNNDESLKNDFNEIMLYLFYKSDIDKIQKQWKIDESKKEEGKQSQTDPHNITSIFLENTWENYVRTSLNTWHKDIMIKIINDQVEATDFPAIYKYMQLINTIIFAVLLDYYILGRIMREDVVSDNIIIYTGNAHTNNYITILKEYYGYEENI